MKNLKNLKSKQVSYELIDNIQGGDIPYIGTASYSEYNPDYADNPVAIIGQVGYNIGAAIFNVGASGANTVIAGINAWFN